MSALAQYGDGQSQYHFESQLCGDSQGSYVSAQDPLYDSSDSDSESEEDTGTEGKGNGYREIDFSELVFAEKIGSGAFGTVWKVRMTTCENGHNELTVNYFGLSG